MLYVSLYSNSLMFKISSDEEFRCGFHYDDFLLLLVFSISLVTVQYVFFSVIQAVSEMILLFSQKIILVLYNYIHIIYGVSLCIGFLKADRIHFFCQIYLFNRLWSEGSLPLDWKISKYTHYL